jgi:hypothetical protein
MEGRSCRLCNPLIRSNATYLEIHIRQVWATEPEGLFVRLMEGPLIASVSRVSLWHKQATGIGEQRMRVTRLFVVLTMLSIGSLLLPESGMSMKPTDMDSVGWKPRPEVSFRSIQIDASTSIFWYAFSGSCDVDMIALSPHKHAAIGMRIGAERKGGVARR